ncbi:MAG: hypothetical protein CMI24_00420 [Opitutae bacterium]|nr:hypothetical protein [Opitutae bacterium]|tara:strand:- start:156 stop:353 length:198 start_codon:yes stop_codon:yes gene_type:complete
MMEILLIRNPNTMRKPIQELLHADRKTKEKEGGGQVTILCFKNLILNLLYQDMVHFSLVLRLKFD